MFSGDCRLFLFTLKPDQVSVGLMTQTDSQFEPQHVSNWNGSTSGPTQRERSCCSCCCQQETFYNLHTGCDEVMEAAGGAVWLIHSHRVTRGGGGSRERSLRENRRMDFLVGATPQSLYRGWSWLMISVSLPPLCRLWWVCCCFFCQIWNEGKPQKYLLLPKNLFKCSQLSLSFSV